MSEHDHQQDDREKGEDDAKEDLELKDEDADQVRGGMSIKSTDK